MTVKYGAAGEAWLREHYGAGDVHDTLDAFDVPQLACVIRLCRSSSTLSEAGRRLFASSRLTKATSNDADRLRKYLARFGLDWRGVKRR